MNTETNTAASTETKRSPGRPKHVLKYPRGMFTVEELYELNRGEKGRGKRAKVCRLTVRKHIAEQVALGFLTKVANVDSGKPGQPAHRYLRTAVKAAADAARAARAAATPETPAEAPVPEASLVEAPVVEAPAETAPAAV